MLSLRPCCWCIITRGNPEDSVFGKGSTGTFWDPVEPQRRTRRLPAAHAPPPLLSSLMSPPSLSWMLASARALRSQLGRPKAPLSAARTCSSNKTSPLHWAIGLIADHAWLGCPHLPHPSPFVPHCNRARNIPVRCAATLARLCLAKLWVVWVMACCNTTQHTAGAALCCHNALHCLPRACRLR